MNRLNDSLRCIGNTTHSAIDAGRRVFRASHLIRLLLSRAQHDKALGDLRVSHGRRGTARIHGSSHRSLERSLRLEVWQMQKVVEYPYVKEDRETQLVTALYAEDLEGRLHEEEPWANPWVYGFPPAVPFLRGIVVVASYLSAGGGRELPLNVATLYGERGIEAIVTKPSPLLHSDDIPCNMNYLTRKVAELQNMPKEE